MHKEKVHYTVQATQEEKVAEVACYDTLDEAKKDLGEKGMLEAINDNLVQKAQRKLRHGSQLERSKTKRATDKAMREFAVAKGFDPAKIKV